MVYEFRTADGRVCCEGDDAQLLCETCKARAAKLPTTDDNDPMASYRRGINKKVVTRTTAADDPYRNPPNGYQLALERQRQEAR